MRVAFVGKGGAGKSAISGTFARLLARRGAAVLAIDSDPMPGMAFALGLGANDVPIPDDAVEEKAEGEEGPRFRLRADLDAATAVERYAHPGPDGVRFLQFGKLRGTDNRMRSQMAFRAIVADLPKDRWSLVGDLPGGTRQPFFGWGDYADTYVVVVEPTAKSMLSARRLARLAFKASQPRLVAVANKVRDPADRALVAERTGLEVIGEVPWDEELAQADRLGIAPIDHAPDAAAVAAVGSLLDRLEGGVA